MNNVIAQYFDDLNFKVKMTTMSLRPPTEEEEREGNYGDNVEEEEEDTTTQYVSGANNDEVAYELRKLLRNGGFLFEIDWIGKRGMAEPQQDYRTGNTETNYIFFDNIPDDIVETAKNESWSEDNILG